MNILSSPLMRANILSGLTVALALETSACITGAASKWGGRTIQRLANQGSSTIEGKTGSYAQRGFSLLYSTGNFIEKLGFLAHRITPFRSSRKEAELRSIFDRDYYLDLKRYLSNNPNVINKVDKGRQPIHSAANLGALHCLQYLIANGIGVDARTSFQNKTPLHIAAENGRAKTVEYLLSQGADVDARDKDGRTPLHIAAEKGHTKIVEYLISQGAEVNARTKDGRTALHIAAEKGRAKIVEYLLSKVADIDARDSCDWTPLHRASYHGKVSCLKLLLSKGADPYALSKKGNTPLELAMQKKHDRVVDVLKENFDLTRMVDGETILHKNIRWKQTDVAKAIIALENNGINLPNEKYGATPLHLAAANGDRELAEALNKKGALAGKKDHLGRTPMHLAAINNDEDMIWLLWQWWGKLDVPDLEGKTPLDRAKEKSRPIYDTSVFDKMIGWQAEDLETPWEDYQYQQRDEQGKFITDSNGKTIEFTFVADRLTSDVYAKVDTFWQVRSKALLTFLATPVYLPLSIGKQLAGVVLDLGKISMQVFRTIAEQIKSRKLLLSAITITPIKNIAHAIALRIWQIASAPLYAIGMLFAALYTQVNQLNGRKMMNRMAEGWNETGFLRYMGLAKVGNVAESERGGLRQFV